MIGTPIAFGLTMIVCFTLFYYYWRIRQLRARLAAAQNTPALDDFPVEFGIGRNIVETFPSIKACDLKCTASEDLQCPICLVEYEDWEVLRQLPFCQHVFHSVCVGAWFEKQTTCPVCRKSMSELTASFGELLAEEHRQMHCREGPPSTDATLEVISDSSAPSWMMHNRRLPLPAPPVPALTTEGTLHVTCPSGNGTELLTQPKAVTEHAQLETRQKRGDFHVISIPQEDRRHTCKCSTKLVKIVPSDEPTAIPEHRHQSVVQILVQIQEGIQTKPRESNDNLPCQVRSQETLGLNEFTATQPAVVEASGVLNNRRCVSDDSRRNSEDIRVPEDVQAPSQKSQGSFEFQPVPRAGGLPSRATTQRRSESTRESTSAYTYTSQCP